jgi:uncharacterized protein (DUF4415 family)
MSKLSESSRQGKQQLVKRQHMSKELAAELLGLSRIRDGDIDMDGLPEQLDWKDAAMGKYYRPIKEPISLRVDADVLDWFKACGKGYQSRINKVLRAYFLTQTASNQFTFQKNSTVVKEARKSYSTSAVSRKSASAKRTTHR